MARTRSRRPRCMRAPWPTRPAQATRSPPASSLHGSTERPRPTPLVRVTPWPPVRSEVMLDRMSLRVRDVFMSELGALRYEPIEKRIRGVIGGETVVDSTRTRLVWEPRRVVPDYAVPEEDVAGEIASATDGAAPLPGELPRLGERP